MLQDAQSTSSPTESLSRDRTPSRLSSSCNAAFPGETHSTSSPPLLNEVNIIKTEPIDGGSPEEVLLVDDDDGVRCNGSLLRRRSASRSPSIHNLEVRLDDQDELATGGCSFDAAAVLSSTNSPMSEEGAAWIRNELRLARNKNLALQEELSNRDFQIAQLAEDFFRLREQFDQLSRRFQHALCDSHQPDRSDVD